MTACERMTPPPLPNTPLPPLPPPLQDDAGVSHEPSGTRLQIHDLTEAAHKARDGSITKIKTAKY